MEAVLMGVHLLVSIILIAVVLIQRGQGADMGASFGGGGAQTLFGSRGSGSFLGKMTGGLAAVFMLTSLSLAFFTQQKATSVVGEVAPVMHASQQSAKPASDSGAVDPSSLGEKKAVPAEGLPAAE